MPILAKDFRVIAPLMLSLVIAQPSGAQMSKPHGSPALDLDAWATAGPESEETKATSCSLSSCSNVCWEKRSACLQLDCPETAWQVCVQDRGLKGLWVGPVNLRRKPSEPWMRVLYEAGPAEIYVPYHDGDPQHRLWDMRYCTAPHVCLREVVPEDAGAHGQLVTFSGDIVPRVVAEVRDRGVAWMCKWADSSSSLPAGSLTRRGQELLLWGVYDTGNYDYILQYGFRDDGAISFRVGATGYNNPNADVTPFQAHMHDVLWYIDMDLNGAGGDTALVTAHQEGSPTALEATDSETWFNGGVEGKLAWDPELFHSLLLEDSSLNAHGSPIGYELIPFRAGSSRHQGSDETFTLYDFFVTRWQWNELAWMTTWQSPEQFVMGIGSSPGAGIANQQPVLANDLVLWHLSSAHHEPHDEDQAAGNTGMEGVTLVHWMGCDLSPHNLFDYNPLGGPHREQCAYSCLPICL